MHEYTVELRIHGSDLDVSSVTERLGLAPSLIRNVGDRRNGTTQWEEAMWSYNGAPESPLSTTWSSLEEGLSSILQKLWPSRHELEFLKNKYKVILWCGHFQSDADGGPTLSPSILKRLGDFGVELFIDNYFCGES
jgi:hypothetical protein